MSIGTSALAPTSQKFYDKVLLERALPHLAYESLAQMRPLKSKTGTTINFRKFNSLNPALSALTEGETPSTTPYAMSEVEATVKQYGAVVGITDMVDKTKPDPHLTELSEVLSEQMANTKDQITRDLCVPAFTNAWYVLAGGVTTDQTGPAAAAPKQTIWELAHKNLRNSNAPYWTRMIKPGPGVESHPVGPSYWAIVHPNVAYHFRNDATYTNWIPVQAYANQQETMPNEIGSVANIRFIESTNAYNDGTNYYTMIVSPNAFGVTRLDGMAGQSYFTDFGEGDDRLRQRAYLGWKLATTATPLNDAFAHVVISTV